MRFLLRNAIFILFPLVVVAIIFLAQISFGTAVRYGEWGERSIAESTLIVTKEKIERIEHTIRTTDDAFFGIVDPSAVELACDRWRAAPEIVEAAALLDEVGDVVFFFHRAPTEDVRRGLHRMITAEIAPLVDKYDSVDGYKHLHRKVGADYRLITHFTTPFEGQDYTAVIVYSTPEIVDELLAPVLDNVGEDRIANVVDDRNEIIFGDPIDGSGAFIVGRNFPSTLYKWRLQLAPTASALFSAKEQERAKRFSQVMLIPLAIGVIVLGLGVLYMSVVRERRLNRLKSDFVANISHELKTPISLIRMFGELLLLGKVEDPAKSRRYCEVILRESDRLSTLIDNVLNLSRIERGKNPYLFTELDVAEVVERAVEVFGHRLEKTGLKLVHRAERDLPRCRVDEQAIALATMNLLDNAAKYGKGTDVVGCEVYVRDGFVHIDVFDHGVGIPEQHQRRIFERFFRVPTPETRTQRGSGIGLSLVKQIAEAHGGTIAVASTPHGETRFSLRLPAAR